MTAFTHTNGTRNKLKNGEKENYQSTFNIVLMSQQKQEDIGNTFWGEILRSDIPEDQGSFLELNEMKAFWKLYQKAKQNFETVKFGNRNKLKSNYTATQPCAISSFEISIITYVVNLDILLLLSKEAMKGRKPPMKCMSSDYYHIPITRPLSGRGKFNQKILSKKLQLKTDES